MADSETEDAIERMLDAMIERQHAKLLSLARLSVPGLTEDDLKNPDDFPALHRDVRFNYEDGILAGLRMAAAAWRARCRERSGR